ncbi:MAG: hypothetical protein ACD_42C00130G0001 [uncultured bacterium]|nr:MAG: hypothetical protein ACD_42C00130G0001 [uncultured bacterium]
MKKIIAEDKHNTDFLREKNWAEIVLSHYDPLAHTQSFRDAFVLCTTVKEIEEIFIRERKKYPLRNFTLE